MCRISIKRPIPIHIFVWHSYFSSLSSSSSANMSQTRNLAWLNRILLYRERTLSGSNGSYLAYGRKSAYKCVFYKYPKVSLHSHNKTQFPVVNVTITHLRLLLLHIHIAYTKSLAFRYAVFFFFCVLANIMACQQLHILYKHHRMHSQLYPMHKRR